MTIQTLTLLLLGLISILVLLRETSITKLKIIKTDNKWFMIRYTIYLKTGSIKLHIILKDDIDEVHDHPWDFKSLLIIPYKEILHTKDLEFQNCTEIAHINHHMFSIVKRNHKQKHKTQLYSISGIKIPAITIGRYYEKKQLCSFCKDLGYCKSNKH